MKTTRTFIAVPLPTVARKGVEKILLGLSGVPAVRWVKPEALPLTLAFLGDMADEQLAPLM